MGQGLLFGYRGAITCPSPPPSIERGVLLVGGMEVAPDDDDHDDDHDDDVYDDNDDVYDDDDHHVYVR